MTWRGATFRAAAKPIGVAWRFAVGGDLNLPEVEGPQTTVIAHH